MCGICGRLELTSRPASPAIVQGMQARLAHRGPDDATVWVRGPLALGHRRLSIIDIEGGRQPVTNETDDVVAILNGEIYNHDLLRSMLVDRGHTFRSRSDTEVLVHAYEEWDVAFVDRLHGMFALALWDARRRRLVLVRDRLGIKPLFIHHAPGRSLTFASELGALWCDEDVPRQPDPVAIEQFLSLQYVPAPRTGLAAVEKLPPAHLLIAERGTVCVREYWDPAGVEIAGSRRQAAVELRSALADAVRSHLVSDVPVGSFLSGGIDSGVVTALMATQTEEPVRAITVGFGSRALDERPAASELARRYACTHIVRSADQSIGESFDRVVSRLDEPFADWSAIPTFLVSEAARAEVKVVLSGDGGDELFGGYARHRVERIEGVVRRVSRHVPRGVLRALVARYPRYMPGHGSVQLLTDDRPLSIARKHAHGFFARADERRLLHGEALRDALVCSHREGEAFAAAFEHWYERIRHRDPITAALYLELKSYLVDDVLTKVDRMSMAHSLEVRVPLLDHRVVELALSFPPSWKIGWRRGKRILREACGDLLPRAAWHRPKMGFDIPAAQWLRAELRTRASALLLDGPAARTGLVSRSAVERLWRQHQLGHRDHARRLWALIMLQAWLGNVESCGREARPLAALC